MAPIMAAVTCDIRDSSKYSEVERRKVRRVVEEAFDLLSSRYPEAVHATASFSVVQGDEFQFALNDPGRAYEILFYYRSLAATADVRPVLRFRASIGIGALSITEGETSYRMDGRAFHHSRRGLERLKRSRDLRRRSTQIVTGRARDDAFLDLVLMYQDMLESGWTRTQWEAVRWRQELPTYERIADQIGIKYQNVQKRLRAARWTEFDAGLKAIAARLAGRTP